MSIKDYTSQIFHEIKNKKEQQMRFYYKHLQKPIKENTALFESYHAASTTGNPYAIYMELCKSHPNITKFWIYKSESPLTDFLREDSCTHLVKFESNQYFKILATTKYLFNDTSFMPYFSKRKEQIYTNTWHGTPLKTLGRDIKNSPISAHKNIQKNLLSADYLALPNTFTAKKLTHANDVNGILNSKILISGNARVDLTLCPSGNMYEKYNENPLKKIILYAPTWKKTVDKTTHKDIENLIQQVKELQKVVPDNYSVKLKIHYFISDIITEMGFEELIVPPWVETNEYLSIVEELITDYSSIFFDFLPLKKPIYFFMPDIHFYQEERGLYLDIKLLPGECSFTFDKLLADLSRSRKKESVKARKKVDNFIKLYCPFDDGNASKRIINTIIDDVKSCDIISYKSDKKVLLFYPGGLYHNGITHSLINLTNALDYNKYEVVFLEFGGIDTPEKAENFYKFNSKIKFIYKSGANPKSLSNSINNKLFIRRTLSGSLVNQNKVKQFYRSESLRIISPISPDICIDFSGYNIYAASLLAFSEVNKKYIYNHSTLIGDYNKRRNGKPLHRMTVRTITSIYNHFSKIVSVSDSANIQNKDFIKKRIPNFDLSKMIHIENTIDSDDILHKLDTLQTQDFIDTSKFNIVDTNMLNERVNTLTCVKNFEKNEINFICVARLSPEKNHLKMIEAFSNICKIYDHVKLHLIGHGPEKNAIEQYLLKINMHNKIYLYGHINNPYKLVHDSDCLVLFSEFEGQGLSLIESLIIGTPVIATNVSGISDVITHKQNGYLVDNTVSGMQKGFQAFIDKKVPSPFFDPITYKDKSITKFYSLLNE